MNFVFKLDIGDVIGIIVVLFWLGIILLCFIIDKVEGVKTKFRRWKEKQKKGNNDGSEDEAV